MSRSTEWDQKIPGSLCALSCFCLLLFGRQGESVSENLIELVAIERCPSLIALISQLNLSFIGNFLPSSHFCFKHPTINLSFSTCLDSTPRLLQTFANKVTARNPGKLHQLQSHQSASPQQTLLFSFFNFSQCKETGTAGAS